MGKAFYRKYRSKSLSEVVGQAHITDALTTALKNGAVSHAYLFTGPRGVGKTSVARILAHEINQLPYTDESSHLDIIEIDAASNRRIDEIRDLKDKVHVAPTSAKYKVYIIDEVHMLTKEAFNALLKTLEEPPAHVVFILATTEAHKLPETIVSRTQRFTFKPVDMAAVVAHLAGIAKQEGISIDDAALQLIAEHGEGSFRDSISLLDQMRHSAGKVTASDVEHALGIAPKTLVEATIAAINSADRQAIEQTLHDVSEKGVGLVQFSHQLAVAWRQHMLGHDVTNSGLQLLDELARVGTHPSPNVALALALYRPIATADIVPQQAQQPAAEPAKAATAPTAPVEPTPEPLPVNDEYAEETPMPPFEEPDAVVTFVGQPPAAETESVVPAADDHSSTSDWERILQSLKKRHNTLYGVVRMSTPTIGDDSLTLGFAFPFHVRRITDEKNRRVIEDVVHEALGKRLTVKAVKTEKSLPKAPSTKATAAPVDHLTSVSNIFGGAEIVES